ncbi:MAG: hypothetical protein N3A38_04670 [Planctomycetota bacterium]|nr:hypothetical protein [Planctomycetota bacterium]
MRTVWIPVLCAAAVFTAALAAARPSAVAGEEKESAPQAQARKPLSASVEASFLTKYVRRGIVVSPEYVAQPSAFLSYRGLSASVWANMDLTDENCAEREITEIDYTLEYSGAWKKLNYSLGVTHYTRPDIGAHTDEPATTEAHAAIGLDVMANPRLKVFQDINQVKGTYVGFSMYTEEEFWRPVDWAGLSLGLGGSVGWGSHSHNAFYYYRGDMMGWGTPKHEKTRKENARAAFTDLQLTASLPLKIGSYITIKPVFHWSTLLDKRIRHAMRHDDNIFGGISLSVGF